MNTLEYTAEATLGYIFDTKSISYERITIICYNTILINNTNTQHNEQIKRNTRDAIIIS
jgi:hypothetical protein